MSDMILTAYGRLRNKNYSPKTRQTNVFLSDVEVHSPYVLGTQYPGMELSVIIPTIHGVRNFSRIWYPIWDYAETESLSIDV
jgi:hypothetical protein